MSGNFLSALLGTCAGVFLGALLAALSQQKAVDQGWMQHRSAIYLIVPAKPVPAP